MKRDKESKGKAEDAKESVFGDASGVPSNKPSSGQDSGQSSNDASMPSRKHANTREEGEMGQMIEILMDTPIDPDPSFKPPLDEQQALYLSSETEEMLEAAVTVMKQEMKENRKDVSKSLVAEIALRSILFDFAENREDSHLMEWFRGVFGTGP